MSRLSVKLNLVGCVVVLLITSVIPVSVFADNTDFYSANDILFYDPTDTCKSNSLSPASINPASINLSDSPQLKQIFQLLVSGGMNAGQASAVMGNMYQESTFNSDRHEIGNDIAYGLAQWSFGRRTNLENFAKQKGVPASDVPMQIEFLLNEYNSSYKSKLDATAFRDGRDIAASTEGWMNVFEKPLMVPANDPAGLNSVRIPAANTVYGLYKNLSPGSVIATSGCNSSNNGAVAGDIVSTALNFALTTPASDGMTQKSDARDTYQTAKEKYRPEADWTDCGGFVSTVMQASGVDPNYPIGTSVQMAYVKAHPEKYTVITNPSKTGSDLQPGDILISTDVGHTIIYTGQQTYPYADASLGHHVPSVRPSTGGMWILQHGAVVARVIK